MSYNSIVLALSDQSVASILQHVTGIRSQVTHTVSLTKDAKSKMAKMGKKRLVWSADTYDYAQQYPLLLSQSKSLQLWGQVKRDYEQLSLILKHLSTLYRALSDTQTQLGTNYYALALEFYDEVKAPINDGEPGILLVREELAKQFEGQGVANEPDPAEDPLLIGTNTGTGDGNATNGGGSPTDGGTAPA